MRSWKMCVTNSSSNALSFGVVLSLSDIETSYKKHSHNSKMHNKEKRTIQMFYQPTS